MMITDQDRNLENMMKDHGVRPTAVRLLIMRVLENARSPISSLDIESILETVDRSTITRALSLFVESDLVHMVADGTATTKYELCRSHEHGGSSSGSDDSCGLDSDLHPHFHCLRCGRTICLYTLRIPPVQLPEGYTPRSASFTFTGLCPACSPKPE